MRRAMMIVFVLMLPSFDVALADVTLRAQRLVHLGLIVSGGGRFDNVRLCTATGDGTRGGPSGDVAATFDFTVGDSSLLRVTVPVMRPILFGAAFAMLQFEPEVSWLWRKALSAKMALLFGPTAGLIVHYGPDYKSAASGAGRGPDFFAMGPKLGGTIALDWPRADRAFGMQLGLSPYVAPLFGIDDPAAHRGVVVGGTLGFGVYL